MTLVYLCILLYVYKSHVSFYIHINIYSSGQESSGVSVEQSVWRYAAHRQCTRVEVTIADWSETFEQLSDFDWLNFTFHPLELCHKRPLCHRGRPYNFLAGDKAANTVTLCHSDDFGPWRQWQNSHHKNSVSHLVFHLQAAIFTEVCQTLIQADVFMKK